jgi:hypothetical protein
MAVVFGISVVISLVLLKVANSAAAKWRYPAVGVGVWSLAAVVMPMCISIVSIVIAIQGILMTAGALFASRAQPKRFLAISIGATLLAYGIAATLSLRQLSALQSRFPVESIETRLPAFRKFGSVHLDTFAKTDLDVADEQIGFESWRSRLLQDLHENSIQMFLAQPGFGVSRMNEGLDRAFEEYRDRMETPELPNSNSLEDLSAGIEVGPMTAARRSDTELRSLHLEWLPDFFESGRQFGYFRDRKHVIGFRPHEFRSRPHSEIRVKKVELVGVIVHAEPVVYRTNGLPTMSKLPKIPIRPLDGFEIKGLKAIESGNALFARQTPTGLRMLGPIRAVNACTACHDCERGRLLGAFSYWID